MKKITYTIYILSLFLMLAAAGCKKNAYSLYKDVARIQFGPTLANLYNNSAQFTDTLKPFTFYYDNSQVKQDTVFFDIYAIGGISSKDRNFKLEQIQQDSVLNAVPDKHYIAFTNQLASKNFVIKADSMHASVPIILLRDPSLQDTAVVLKFQVVANSDFQLGEPDELWRKIQFTDRLSQPAAWTAIFSQYYLGAYSVTKHKFMIDSSGQKWDQNFFTTITQNYALFQYWIGVCKTALINYNSQHQSDPLKDENDQLVIFP